LITDHYGRAFILTEADGKKNKSTGTTGQFDRVDSMGQIGCRDINMALLCDLMLVRGRVIKKFV